MSEVEVRMTRAVVVPVGEPLFSERATTIEIEDEAGGEFVVVSQDAPDHGWVGKIAIDKDDWPALRDAIEIMIQGCRENQDE